MTEDRRPVILSGNSSWNIVNFRVGLIRALEAAGLEPVVVAPIDQPAEDRMAALGVRRFVVTVDRSGLNPLRDLGLLGRYARILGEVRPAAYLGFTAKPNIYGSFAARLCGVPAIPNISGLGTAFIRGGPLAWVLSALYRVALAGAPVVFFQNAEDRALFVSRKLVRVDRARVLPGSGIDLDRFAPEPLPPGPVRFMLVGRLLGDKGVREFVEAARILQAEGADARFTLLGPLDPSNRTGISRGELDDWIGNGNIDYLGETDDVRPAIAASHAIVLPSYREGLPRTLLEGAAMERVLVASDVPGCRDVVDDGINGFLCADRDPVSLAEAMRKVLRLSADERAALGAAGRRRVQAKFNERLVIQAYLDALGHVVRPRS